MLHVLYLAVGGDVDGVIPDFVVSMYLAMGEGEQVTN